MQKGERTADGQHHDHCVIAMRESMKSSIEKEEDEAFADRVRCAVHLSITANIVLCAVTTYAVVSSGSLAVLASLADTLIDLVSQGVLAVSEWVMRKPSDQHYPAGRSRIEPLGVIIVSILMGIAALELFRASITSLVMALAYHQLPSLNMQDRTIIILFVVVGVKFCLFLFSKSLARRSCTAEALSGTTACLDSAGKGLRAKVHMRLTSQGAVWVCLSEDNWNDVMINTFSIISSIVAHFHKELWWFDPAGAIVISSVIMYNWVHVGLEHATKIVGLRSVRQDAGSSHQYKHSLADDGPDVSFWSCPRGSAPPETLEEISTMAGGHHPDLELDIIRAYQ